MRKIISVYMSIPYLKLVEVLCEEVRCDNLSELFRYALFKMLELMQNEECDVGIGECKEWYYFGTTWWVFFKNLVEGGRLIDWCSRGKKISVSLDVVGRELLGLILKKCREFGCPLNYSIASIMRESLVGLYYILHKDEVLEIYNFRRGVRFKIYRYYEEKYGKDLVFDSGEISIDEWQELFGELPYCRALAYGGICVADDEGFCDDVMSLKHLYECAKKWVKVRMGGKE